MDADPNNNDVDSPDPFAALQKARRQAQANVKESRKGKKTGAILHVNNYRSAVPEARVKQKTPHYPASLKPGYVIRSKDSAYAVEARLAARVYMVRNEKTEKFAALKIEPFFNEGDVKQLKRDVFVLVEATKQDSRFNRHFPTILSRGRVPEAFNYMVTSLCDFNLDDLRERVIKGDFSLNTAARLSMQAFQAVHDLHTMGYLHRNIAPNKFMLGLENPTLIYMGGFSTAYHFRRKDGKDSPNSRKLHRLAKIRFLPRAYHRYKEMTRFDDLESWLYTSIDFFGRKLLPWFDSMDESQMVANKERFFFDAFEEIYNYAPKQLQVIQRYIEKNCDDDKPNYTFLGITLVGMRDKLKFPYVGPFDFQGGPATSVSPSHKKKRKKRRDKETAPLSSQQQQQQPSSQPFETEGPAIAPGTSVISRKLPTPPTGAPDIPPSSAPLSNAAPDDKVFEDGEAEAPQEDAKPGLNMDRALSMARKKKTPRNTPAARAAADVEEAGQGALKPVKAETLKNLKKKKAKAPPPPPPPPDDEEDEEDANSAPPPLSHQAPPPAPPPQAPLVIPPPTASAKSGKRKKKSKKVKSKPVTPVPPSAAAPASMAAAPSSSSVAQPASSSQAAPPTPEAPPIIVATPPAPAVADKDPEPDDDNQDDEGENADGSGAGAGGE